MGNRAFFTLGNLGGLKTLAFTLTGMDKKKELIKCKEVGCQLTGIRTERETASDNVKFNKQRF